MNHNRRILLKGTMAASATAMAISAGMLLPKGVIAAWPKDAFTATDIDAALTASHGSKDTTSSDKIKLTAPDIAENGALVPVTVDSSIAGAGVINLLVKENAQPLTATFNLGPDTEAYVSTRIKMSKTSDVIAVVKANGKLYSSSKNVKVTIGGCGG